MDGKLTVRPARLADLVRILDIEAACFGADAYDRNLFAEYTRKCGGLFLVAEWRTAAGTTLCAYSITAISHGKLGDRAELVSVAVAPAFLRHGVATALLESTMRRLRRRHIARLALMVKVSNQRARAFYQKHGFRHVRRVRAYYEDGADGLSLVKDL